MDRIYAPAATPKPIIDKLAAEIAVAMKDPGVVGRLKDAGTEAVGSTSQEASTLSIATNSRFIVESCRTRA